MTGSCATPACLHICKRAQSRCLVRAPHIDWPTRPALCCCNIQRRHVTLHMAADAVGSACPYRFCHGDWHLERHNHLAEPGGGGDDGIDSRGGSSTDDDAALRFLHKLAAAEDFLVAKAHAILGIGSESSRSFYAFLLTRLAARAPPASALSHQLAEASAAAAAADTPVATAAAPLDQDDSGTSQLAINDGCVRAPLRMPAAAAWRLCWPCGLHHC